MEVSPSLVGGRLVLDDVDVGELAGSRRRCRTLMTHKYRGSIVVLSISKSVEPNEEQKEMTSGFQ